jgi:protein tyrosine phosphatase (PTP) superfamily phosphohydrolase (DUF442 family)
MKSRGKYYNHRSETALAGSGKFSLLSLRCPAVLLRSIKIGIVAGGLTAGSCAAYWGAIQYQGNFHAVQKGTFYRSAQLSNDELRNAIREHKIRSILNLRGAHPGQAWYEEEIAVSQALGVTHYDYGLSAHRFVTKQQIGEVLDIIRDAPKPLLVHCKSGADRAGLVSALYRFAGEGVSADQADQELSLVYGHFPYLTSRSKAMDDSFWAFVGAQGASAHGPD